MGTTKIKIIDLSSENQEVKTSRKHAAKIKPRIETEEAAVSTVPTESAPESVKPDKVKQTVTKTKRSSSLRHSGKKYKSASEKIEKDKVYSPDEAIKLLEEISYTSFDPTVEVHLNISEKNLRGQVSFPHPIGPKKEKRFLVFADKIKSDNKNVSIATENTIKEIEEGRIKPTRDFDVVIASAVFMPKLVSIAKILGPAGMMPNPKNGTITNNPQSIFDVKDSDLYDYRSDPTNPIIHAKLGKLSSKESKIKDNLQALISAVGPAKIKNASLKTTMSPPIRIEFA